MESPLIENPPLAPALGATPPRRRGWRGPLVLIALGVAIAGAIAFAVMRAVDPAQAPASGAGKKGGRFAANTGPAPVIVAAAKTGDVNIYLAGLGTVTPLKTVTVRSRVDGELMAVRFTEGQVVKAGEVLAEIDPRPFQVMLTQAEGQMARDRALLGNARIDFERYRLLLKQDSIAEQQVAGQESLVGQYEGAVKMDQSQIDNAKLQLLYSRVTAPISGRLGLRQVDAGNIVRASDPNGLVVITQLQPITVIFTIPQDNLPVVLGRMQSGAPLPVDAYDREQKTRLASGTLLTVDNQIDPTTGTVKLKAQFANDDGKMFPNQFVNVRMLVDTLRGATTVPSSAVQRGVQGVFVYVVGADNTVALRLIDAGPVEGENTAVRSGIRPGELVVVDGTDRLRAGAKVEPTTREAAAAAVARPADSDPSAGKKGGKGRRKGTE